MIYLIGSLRNPAVPHTAIELRRAGYEVFDAWYSAGEKADDSWRDHEQLKGNTLKQALAGAAAQHVFHFDKKYLDLCNAGILLMPAGKSGHLELGYLIGSGKRGYILFDEEPERYDVMLNFAHGIHTNFGDLLAQLRFEVTA